MSYDKITLYILCIITIPTSIISMQEKRNPLSDHTGRLITELTKRKTNYINTTNSLTYLYIDPESIKERSTQTIRITQESRQTIDDFSYDNPIFLKISIDQKKIELDGPNQDQAIVIAQEGKSFQSPKTRFYLFSFDINNKMVRKPNFQSDDINGRLKTVALAAHNCMALVVNAGFPNQMRDILKLYNYNKYLNATLIAQQNLPGTLSQVAFITKNLMLGLTGDKQLVSLWVTEKNEIKHAVHTFPFPLISFAVDSANPDQIIFCYNNGNGSFKLSFATGSLTAFESPNRHFFVPIDPEINYSSKLLYKHGIFERFNITVDYLSKISLAKELCFKKLK